MHPRDTPDVEQALATQINYRSSVAALTFLLYDICLTFDDEVNFVWPKAWTRMKFLFLFIRYVPLFVQFSILVIGSPELTPHFHFTPHDCFIWEVYQGVATVLILAAVDCVLILRVCALYHNKPIIRRLVLLAFLLEVTGMIVGLGLSVSTITFDDICLITHVSTLLLIYAGSTLIFQTFLFALTAIHFGRALREGWGDTPLVHLVMRDGTWAFLLLFAVLVGASSLYTVKNQSYAGIIYGWLLTVFSFSGYRVLLNLDRLSSTSPRLDTTNNTPWEFTTRLTAVEEAAQTYELTTVEDASSTGP
ncbi:hypothetical protein FB45DRAFT_822622 [Roridomyces roridus]|uniref:DUF6533 domain-containing protein n=1 Tax=Roridomyces roridus TaxID=1738132 RepID=A0AAD7CGB3_9AGAR|nr:hypothetical protein FB45DRAFT_822622 [Roridomyces roridus]